MQFPRALAFALALSVAAAMHVAAETTHAPAEPASKDGEMVPWLGSKLDQALDAYRQAPDRAHLKKIFDALPRHNAEVYIVEGDMKMLVPDVCMWIARMTGKTAPPGSTCDLPARPKPVQSNKQLRFAGRANCDDPLDIRPPCIWAFSQRDLTYYVDETSFTTKNISPETVALLANEFQKAADAWVDACGNECNLTISRVTERSKKDNHFVVQYDCTPTYVEDAYLASAFFPYDDGALRTVVIRPDLLIADYSAEQHGVCPASDVMEVTDSLAVSHTLRHEIGHILGYAHEEYAKEDLDCCRLKDNDSCKATVSNAKGGAIYDFESVMHSTGCEGESAFRRSGKLSCADKKLHRSYYGGHTKDGHGRRPSQVSLEECLESEGAP